MPDLEDLYREIILDHYRNPRNRGELDTPPAVRAEGFNPLCGDEVIVYVRLANGVVDDIKFGGQGCSISQASSSMMSAIVKGRTTDELHRLNRAFKSMMSIEPDPDDPAPANGNGADIKLGDLEALKGVVKFPVRIKCATLSWHTLIQAVEEAQTTG
ncbi:MAG: SUF system NifU family Fe-S cluster assembly protein [Acidimicrobiia bacterium]|nr:SUF system NifU family Fe-S cluster assembly protein [Acidimicrobiia bacterium]MYE72201.1 SUF system NifU family Fe-S cluster assembly protein [Acidimicrobiia bacterium]MYH97707.1 SUF system NifU family Fe-S cluster assembly protein [Acidimicrobiia bacterium]MYJ61902.1 SUF system NifU family Fe-S cluster assembly protein [Acidimicrobiia bacterium]MYL09510.1 SUF system NifU family Fe-S cluster assembly protein [Acidimicrobiia bacterium]